MKIDVVNSGYKVIPITKRFIQDKKSNNPQKEIILKDKSLGKIIDIYA